MWTKSGAIPQPQRIGHPTYGKLIWPRQTIIDWVAQGCLAKNLKRAQRIMANIKAMEEKRAAREIKE
jgi:hypothetical protein